MQSKSTTVGGYLNELTPERREAIETVRQTILEHLPNGYEETMQYGMITYVVPLSLYPAGYLGKKDVPLPYAALASQKNYMAVYLLNIYPNSSLHDWFVSEYKKTGKKLDIGKSCVRFKTIQDLPVELIGEVVAKTSVEDCIHAYEEARGK
jgi:uncharacterized protein YdhG (YjbR/CyaY superfamily)